MKTMEDLRLVIEEEKADLKKHKEWLKQYDYFVIISQKPFFDEKGTVVFRLSDLRDELEDVGCKKFKGTVEIVYKTNKWAESLPELG